MSAKVSFRVAHCASLMTERGDSGCSVISGIYPPVHWRNRTPDGVENGEGLAGKNVRPEATTSQINRWQQLAGLLRAW